MFQEQGQTREDIPVWNTRQILAGAQRPERIGRFGLLHFGSPLPIGLRMSDPVTSSVNTRESVLRNEPSDWWREIDELPNENVEAPEVLGTTPRKTISAVPKPNVITNVPRRVSVIDRSRERRWVSENRETYAGLWVALDGDRLVASGKDANIVFAEADRSGVLRPLFLHLDPLDAPRFGGW
jgi:hypothetical protein